MKTSMGLAKKAMLLAAPTVFACLANVASAADVSLADIPMHVKVYGFLNAQVESIEAKGGATPYERRGRVSDGNSRIGFSGSVGLKDDFKAIWQIEGSLNAFEQGGTNDQGSSATLTSRNTFIGVENLRYGRLLAGNHDSAYRSLVGSGGELGGNLGLTSHGLDLWNNTSAQMTGNWNSVFSRGEARYKNSVHYFSPEYYGLQAAASYGFDENDSSSNARDRYSAALKYTRGPFEIGVGYDMQRHTGINTSRLEAGYGLKIDGEDNQNTRYAKVVASYKLPTKTYVGVGFEQASYGYEQFVQAGTTGSSVNALVDGHMKQAGWMASIAQDIGNTSLMFSYARLGKMKDAIFGSEQDYEATQFSLGAKYKINDAFATYAYFTHINNKSQQSVNLGQSPVYSNNSGSSDAYLAPGDSPRAFGVGLIARF